MEKRQTKAGQDNANFIAKQCCGFWKTGSSINEQPRTCISKNNFAIILWKSRSSPSNCHYEYGSPLNLTHLAFLCYPLPHWCISFIAKLYLKGPSSHPLMSTWCRDHHILWEQSPRCPAQTHRMIKYEGMCPTSPRLVAPHITLGGMENILCCPKKERDPVSGHVLGFHRNFSRPMSFKFMVWSDPSVSWWRRRNSK